LNECVLSLEYGRLLPAVSAWWGISVEFAVLASAVTVVMAATAS